MSCACDRLSALPLYHCSMLWRGHSNPVFIKGEYKRKPFETSLNPFDSTGFHYCSSVCVRVRVHTYVFKGSGFRPKTHSAASK